MGTLIRPHVISSSTRLNRTHSSRLHSNNLRPYQKRSNMGTLIRSHVISSSTRLNVHTPSPGIIQTTCTPSRKGIQHRVHCRLDSFLDLKPESKPEFLDIDLPRHISFDSSRYDVIIIGAGPAGIRLAECLSVHGIKVCCVDPSPLLVFPNTFGAWVDEFESLGLENCLDNIWPTSVVYINDHKTKYQNRPYGRINRKMLKMSLMEKCVLHGVKFHKAKALEIVHQEALESAAVMCDDGCQLRGRLVVDASGYATSFLEFDKPRNHAYQIAHGILAEVEEHPFDVDKMVLMDWRDSHMGNESDMNNKLPTMLYAMPISSNLIYLEETSLVSRPMLPYTEVQNRMAARLRHLGIKVKQVIKDEKCLIPMGGSLPRIPQKVLGIGGAAGLVHPCTGYMVARVMALAPILANVIVECLGSTTVTEDQLHHRVWNNLWTPDMRRSREYYCFGMEMLLKLDLKGIRGFLDAFYDMDPGYLEGFLSSKFSIEELILQGSPLFFRASNSCKFDMLTKCPLPFLKMVGNLAQIR